MENMELERKELEREISPIVSMAQDFDITSLDDSHFAQDILRKIKGMYKKAYARVHPTVDATHKAWKTAKDMENSVLNPLSKAETILKNKIALFDDNLKRKQNEEAAKAEAKRQEDERKEKERLESLAKKAEEKGKPEKAEVYREQAETFVAPPTFTPPAPAHVSGVSTKTVWKGEVTDLYALCQFVSQNKGLISLLTFNQSGIDKYADLTKGAITVPGVRFFSKSIVSVKGA